jgi:spore coat polysaccharide biosynthesis protein SpsF (cytidylyltransferase family)
MEVRRMKVTRVMRITTQCPYWLAALLITSLVMLPSRATAETPTREQNIDEIVKIAGVEALIQESRADSLQTARTRMEKARIELNPYLSNMSKEYKHQFDAALDKYLITVTTSIDSAAAATEWAECSLRGSAIASSGELWSFHVHRSATKC